MGGAVPPLPQYAFVVWCSVRGSTELPTTKSRVLPVSVRVQETWDYSTGKIIVICIATKQ